MKIIAIIFFALTTHNLLGQPNQRVIIIMFDGFGEDYYRKSEMPTLNGIEKNGFYKVVSGLMPSVTNVNNASICTGTLPDKNGITSNSFYDAKRNSEEFMESDTLLLMPTIFERAKKVGVKSMLLSSKKKSVGLLHRGTIEAVSPEIASAEWINRIGTAPSIYSREINYWLMEAALYSLKNDPGIGILYIHTTDYPMHTWYPDSGESKEHLKKMDDYIARLIKTAPDAMILITADHGMNHKSVCRDLEKICENSNTPVKIAISADRDRYVKHHRGFGGSSYVYLNSPKDLDGVRNTISKIKGVDEVLTRMDAAKRFHLMPERIGDLMVLGDKGTVFGDLDTEYESLPETYRNHGSSYETTVPLFIYNAKKLPPSEYFSNNYKIARWLYND